MALHNEEIPPALPQRQYPTSSMDVHAVSKGDLEDSLNKLHNSLTLQITNYHSIVERVLNDDNSYVRVGQPQAPNGLEALITSLWSLMEPQRKMPLHDFKEDPVGQIANRFSILEEQVTLLREEKRAAQNEVATATHRLAASSKEVNEAKAQSRRLQENNSQLRSIILKGSNSNTDVPDDRIRNSFVELRDLIQRIVHRHYSAQGQMRLKSQGNAHFEAQKRFRNYVKDLTAEPIQKFAIRARLFKFIDDYLLRARSFGVDRYEKDLDDFERELDRSKNVSHAELVEWRSRTIECGTWLDEKSRWPSETKDVILDFMAPFESGTNRDTLGRSMFELCDKAYNLSVLLRRSRKATFETFAWEKDTPVTAAVEGDTSCQMLIGSAQLDSSSLSRSKIYITISGALMKIPEGSSGERVMLEKSHVVCRC